MNLALDLLLWNPRGELVLRVHMTISDKKENGKKKEKLRKRHTVACVANMTEHRPYSSLYHKKDGVLRVNLDTTELNYDKTSLGASTSWTNLPPPSLIFLVNLFESFKRIWHTCQSTLPRRTIQELRSLGPLARRKTVTVILFVAWCTARTRIATCAIWNAR